MSPSNLLRTTITALMVSSLIAVGSPALADKPSKSDRDKERKHEQKGDHKEHGHKDDHHHGKEKKRHFEERDRTVIREYYEQEFRAGHCPPGLEKKHNGCLPPGQAKQWTVGRPLPPNVTYYELPQSVTVRLTPPPMGYRYIRVANDLLMIATGTGMIMEAIDDLSQ